MFLKLLPTFILIRHQRRQFFLRNIDMLRSKIEDFNRLLNCIFLLVGLSHCRQSCYLFEIWLELRFTLISWFRWPPASDGISCIMWFLFVISAAWRSSRRVIVEKFIEPLELLFWALSAYNTRILLLSHLHFGILRSTCFTDWCLTVISSWILVERRQRKFTGLRLSKFDPLHSSDLNFFFNHGFIVYFSSVLSLS